jgi:dTDP-4-amino-4,6-dideoxygalactose transaminase
MSLAILGGKPIYEKPLYVIKPFLPSKKDLYSIIDEIYSSRILSNNGCFSQKFEEKLSEYLNVKHVLLVSSATIGLQLLIKALDIKNEVIMPSFTFIATAHSATWEGCTPVFADIEPKFCTIDVSTLERHITEKTSAVIGVHLFGNSCEIDELDNFCKKYDLKLIFDAAQALGSRYKGSRLGKFGNAEVFSLHATKIINSLEGGFITTEDTGLYKKLVLMRNFGFSSYDKVDCVGINAKMNELSAAIGLKSLETLEENISKNKQNYELYNLLLKDVPGIRMLNMQRPECDNNYHSCQIFIEDDFELSRDELYKILWKENIIARRYYYPGCHQQEPYKRSEISYDYLKVSNEVAQKSLCLPSFSNLKEEDIKKITQIIHKAFENKVQIKKILREN